MKKITLLVVSIGMTFLSSAGMAQDDDGAIETMARITKNLHQRPTDEDREALKSIIDSDDSTEAEADIAMALANFERKVVEKDTERLSDIVTDDETDEDARQLADILLRINDAPSDEDKTALAALEKE